ncbi:MAG: hypothetical protein J6T14_07140 [Clostridia bacterium]|nr:hypothetical protein [Clostridia bacterium]
MAKGRKSRYRVVWSIEHATDEFDAGYDFEDAKLQAVELIHNWMSQFKGEEHDDVVGDWDQMVMNSEVAVYEYDPEKKEFETAWEPNDKDLYEIGFIPSDEMNDAQKAAQFGNLDGGYCGDCLHCDGVDEASDTCVCKIDDPHADWRYRNNEKCPKWQKEYQ